MKGDSILKIIMEEPEQREGRRLRSKNSKHRKRYLEEVRKNLEDHNIYDRVGELGRRSLDGLLQEADVNEYKKKLIIV